MSEIKSTVGMGKHCLTNKSEVPRSSSVSDCMRETCTPISRWIPLHSIQSKTPRFVDNQVGSKQAHYCYITQDRYLKLAQ